MKILTINPGSTSTKIALFVDGTKTFSSNVSHDADELARYEETADQLPYRMQTIRAELEKDDVVLDGLDAVVGRGGGLMSLEGGTYKVDERLLRDAQAEINGVPHPASLGSQLAHEFAVEYGVPAFVVNPPDTDEFQEVARITGVKGVYRVSKLHALNLKETAIRHAAVLGKPYDQCNFVVCHIGGGISISAHRQGKMVDGTDIVNGEGPMAPTRCGALPVVEAVRLCAESSPAAVKAFCTKTGGFVSHCGTSDARTLEERAKQGDKRAQLVWDATIYQIGKAIGSMAAVLRGDVDTIVLGGGMVHSKSLVEGIEDYCGWIAPVAAYPGEFEMEAMAAGAERVLAGVEEAKRYTGKPAWTPPVWLEAEEDSQKAHDDPGCGIRAGASLRAS